MRKPVSARTGLLIHGIVILFFSCIFCSCGNTRQITYMQGKFDTAKLSEIKIPPSIIRKGDLLSIIVYSDNPTATALFNQSLITVNNGAASSGNSAGGAAGGGTGSTAGAVTAGSPTTPGYLVDEGGNIQFQGLGQLHVEGLTKDQLKDTLNSRLNVYLKNPYYTIRFMNYRFTMLGEVTHPGIFSIPGEHVSMLEAIGLAGDLTFFGRRDNVLIMRENNEGKREWARLDLTKPEMMASPYYYLQQNDVVYVEATRKKIAASDVTTARNITIATTIVSTLAILYSIFRK